MADSGSARLPIERHPRRPATRRDFEIAIICALTLEADAVDALFDYCWDDDGPPYDKAPGDPNAYSTGAIGRHNVVLARMSGMGKANAAAVAANCRASFPNIKLAVIVGVCGAVPFDPHGGEIVLGDVIISDGVVQYDLGRQLPERFMRKDTLLDSLGRPNAEIRSLLAKLKGRRGRKMLRDKIATYMNVLQAEPDLVAEYPGIKYDRLFEAAYRHIADGESCDECGCAGSLVPRRRLEQDSPVPAVHFGLIASGDTVMKSGEERDAIARQDNIVGFEMEGAGVWDIFPCVVIKGACDYADSHKTKAWQRYAAATAAACMKAFLDHWVPSSSSQSGLRPVLEQATGPWFLVPYPRNDTFIGRTAILEKLQQLPLKSASQARVSLFGLGGIGKTQIALEYTYWLQGTHPDVSVFWVHASNAQRFRQSFASIALECRIPGYDNPKADMLLLVKEWLERKDRQCWLMVLDNADDAQLFFPSTREPEQANSISQDEHLGQYIPECAHGSILITTRNKQAGLKLAKRPPLEIGRMNDDESEQLLRTNLGGQDVATDELLILSYRLEHLPLALVQATAYIEANTIAVGEYLRILDKSDQDLVGLLSEEFETVGRDSKTPRAIAETWIISFDQIQRQNPFSGELLSLMSFFDRQAIPVEFLAFYNEHQRQDERGEMQLQKALGILKAFSFVTTGKDQSLDVHRLVQLVSRKWLAREKRMKHFTDQALLAVSRAYPFGNYENWVTCRRYLPHAYAVLEFEGSGLKDEKAAKASLLHNVAGFCISQGQWEDAERLQAEAVDLRRNVLGADHPSTLTSMANLASTLWNQGQWEEAERLDVQ
ncbi:uncharacterized protein DNG_06513, partial [Cephalotrichum gorgonifer]